MRSASTLPSSRRSDAKPSSLMTRSVCFRCSSLTLLVSSTSSEARASISSASCCRRTSFDVGGKNATTGFFGAAKAVMEHNAAASRAVRMRGTLYGAAAHGHEETDASADSEEALVQGRARVVRTQRTGEGEAVARGPRADDARAEDPRGVDSLREEQPRARSRLQEGRRPAARRSAVVDLLPEGRRRHRLEPRHSLALAVAQRVATRFADLSGRNVERDALPPAGPREVETRRRPERFRPSTGRHHSPMTFAYTVHAEFDSSDVCTEWQQWLLQGHLADVVKAGALTAELVQWNEKRCEARYTFQDAEAFATYENMHAPPLRAEGLKKFPPSRGVRMSRSTGESKLRLP
ncbi:MAG: hypothetical protein DI536_29680 [Archangium gephyra]|uniref:DUF4286 domain-containing protein n=1 Tax=Archangium gephyra TaxID=48 RepID=A0A2W5SV84_9BACT|nr:MAG: hypothetical protein DI536_29680 [Archangium gephyra]